MAIYISKITSMRGIAGDPPRLCKMITRDDGKLTSTPGANLIDGTVEKIALTSVQDLGELFDTLGTDQAVAFGVTERDGRVMSRGHLERNPTPDAITRSRDNFQWSDGPGVLFNDYDAPKGGMSLSPDDLVDTLRDAVPELGGVELLWRPSSGSCIFDEVTGAQLAGVKGQHLYCIVKRASDIPAMIQTIEGRLWLHGHGRGDVSDSGALLYKTPIDSSVAQPERLDFTRAACGPGLVQRMEPSRVFMTVADALAGAPDLFDEPAWLDSIEPLTAAELAFVAQLKHDAANVPHTLKKVVENRAAHRMKLARESAKPGDDVAALALVIGQQLDAGILPADHPIKLQNGDFVTVTDILANPTEYHGKKCADPLEPDYGDRRTVGMIQTDRYPARITSMAHGGGVHYLFNWQADILAMFEPEPDPLITALRTMAPADILARWVNMPLPRDAVGLKSVVDEVHRLTGTGKRALKAILREKREADHAKKKAVSVARRTGNRQTIVHRPEDATAQAEKVEALIVKNAAPGDYVQFAGVLSHVVTRAPRYAHEIDNPDNPAPPVLQIEPLNAVEILRRVEREAVFVQVNMKGEQTPMGVPGPIQNILINKATHDAPSVTGVASHPIVTPDGDILSADGLDAASGLFFAGAGVPGIGALHQSEAGAALLRLRLALGEGFEFAAPLDLDVAIAALLTGLQRRTLDQAPGLAVLASTQSSGKTTLARMIHVLLTGRDMAVSPFNDDSDEAMTKRLIATLVTNPAMVCFDNIRDGFTFRSAPVATCMTSAVFKDRLLGFSREVSCPTNTLFVLTGNNISLGADEITRWMTCRLTPKAARPESRRFKNPDVVAHALSIRDAVLRDAVGIIAGYRTHAADSIKSCSRFAAWDKMVRQSLIWAGGEDVASVFERNDSQSEESNAHRGLLRALRDVFGAKWFTARDVVTEAAHGLNGTGIVDCLEALRVSKVSDTRSVGHCLTSKAGRAVSVDGGEITLKVLNDSHTGIKKYQVAGMCPPL